MDNSTNDMTDIVKVKTFEFPVAMEALKEVLPKETEGRPQDPKLKLSPLSVGKVLSQDAILALHWLNPPFKEGSLFVPYLYQQIRAVVDDYQLKHEDAFYEQYSELLILKKNERLPSGSELRLNHRKYDRRLAHKVWHYINGVTAYSAALANLMILANVNGTGKETSFGLCCRISAINTASSRFGDFPKPVGLLQKLSNYSKFAAGVTSYGSTFISIPWWRNSIFGNVGQHMFDFSQLYASESEDGDTLVVVDASAADSQHYKTALMNAYNVLKCYGYDTIDTAGAHTSAIGKILDPTGKKNVVPSDPHIENGATMHIKDAAGNSAMVPMSKDGNDIYKGFSYVKKPGGGSGSWNQDNIISRAWDDFNFWQTYMIHFFREFAEFDSQMRIFFTKVIKVLEDSVNTQQFFATINTDHYFDAEDLKNHMIYKKDNKANTATIVKWAPILSYKDDDWFDGLFDDNFNRYPVDSLSESEYLQASEVWPRLTPTVFPDLDNDNTGQTKPHVFNTILTPGTSYDGGIFTSPDRQYYGAKAPVGRYATLLDLASCSNVDAKDSSIDVLAIDPDKAKEFVKKDDALIMKARPTTPLVFEQPLIDCSDPYQCGFNLIISHDAETRDEFSEWFRSTENYIQDKADTNPVDVTLPPIGWGDGSADSKFYPSNPACGAIDVSGTKYMVKAHAMSEAYLVNKKHLVVFIGDNIFVHPAVAGGKLSSGNPSERFYLNDKTTSGVTFFQGVKALANAITDAKLQDNTVAAWDDAVVMSMMQAARLFLDGTSVMPEFKSARELLQKLFDGLQSVEAGKTNKCEIFMFDPAYGPVSPIVYDLPPIGFNPISPLPFDTDIKEDITPDDNAAPLRPMVAFKNQGSTDVIGYEPELANRSPRWKPFETSALFWLWFIDGFKFMKTKMVGYSPSISESPVKLAGCSSFAKALLTMISRSTVYFTGVEDTVPLYGIASDRMRSKEINVSPSGMIKYPSIAFRPRVSAKNYKAKGVSTEAKTPKVINTQQAQATQQIAGTGDFPDKGSTVNDRAPMHKGRKKNKKMKYQKGKDDSGKESMYDNSDKNEDKAFGKDASDKEFINNARTERS